ncbi:MAG: Coenzyme F420 hydrogenase/dehydrogenase, beta subunit C-terminal domain [Alphaproteobacteria bacterium]|nr:Coenzyme F420 hydrogenase/dehydrogenase, beta subunit C-terminal domain [Alphaproteobacteria bacterium]
MIDVAALRAHAKSLLEKGTVRAVIGYRKSTAGLLAEPATIAEAAQADDLIFDPTCVQNLALYLVNDKKERAHSRSDDKRPVAVVAKGCDSRAITVLLQEKHFPRESVHVIGVSCEGTGVVDARKLAKKLDGKKALSVTFDGAEAFSVMTEDGAQSIPAALVMAERCLECRSAHPTLSDMTFGEAKADRTLHAPFQAVKARMKDEQDDRWSFWARQFDRCLRCYACRSVCPMCYCEECVVDSISFAVLPDTTADEKADRIKWIERSPARSETAMYHMVRAIHLAGRCVDCAECERVCPVNIPLRLLNTRLEMEAFETFEYNPGSDMNAPTLTSSFRDTDPNSFIR